MLLTRVAEGQESRTSLVTDASQSEQSESDEESEDNKSGSGDPPGHVD